MSRLPGASVGFELQDGGFFIETDFDQGICLVDTGTVAGNGDYGLCSMLSSDITGSDFAVKQFSDSTISSSIYFKMNMNVSQFPNYDSGGFYFGEIAIVSLCDTFGDFSCNLTLDNSGDYHLYDQGGNDAVTMTTPATPGGFDVVEIHHDADNQLLEITINGVLIGSLNSGFLVPINQYAVGLSVTGLFGTGESSINGIVNFDDIEMDDTDWCGTSYIFHQQPAVGGDNHQFTTAVGGTPAPANNYTRVHEITPDDSSTYNGDNITGHIDDYALTSPPAGMHSYDLVNIVGVGIRYSTTSPATYPQMSARLKSTSGGTLAHGSPMDNPGTAYFTNGNIPTTYTIWEGLTPDSLPWTTSNLATSQVGVQIDTGTAGLGIVSTMWLHVSVTPGTPPPPSASTGATFLLMGV